MKKLIAVLISGLAVMACSAGTIDASKIPPASDKKGVTFDKDIKPIFEKSCFKCHGPDNPKPKGKLKLDTAANALKGGENAPDIIAGKSEKSPLVASIAHAGDEDDFMPPP